MRSNFTLRAAPLVLALSFSVVTLLFFGNAAAQTTTPPGDATFEPAVGQSGKQVILVPTPGALAADMLKTANVKPTGLVYDLGAGDGKMAITSAEDFGATAIGMEFNPKLAQLATRNAKRTGVSDKVKFIEGDIFVEDFSKATLVTLYVLPDLNIRLRPILLEMVYGTRVVSNSFRMGDCTPEQVIGNEQGFFRFVPAKVAGKWALSAIQDTKASGLELTQKYQQLSATLVFDGKSRTILEPTLLGNRLTFNFKDQSDQQRIAEVTVKGKRLAGNVLNKKALYALSGSLNQAPGSGHEEFRFFQRRTCAPPQYAERGRHRCHQPFFA